MRSAAISFKIWLATLCSGQLKSGHRGCFNWALSTGLVVTWGSAPRVFSFLLVSKDCNNTKPYPAGSHKTSTGEKTETFCRRSVFSHWLRRQETDPFLLGTVKASQYEDAWYGLRGHSWMPEKNNFVQILINGYRREESSYLSSIGEEDIQYPKQEAEKVALISLP